jgi:site-specific DNA-cytosine methylase
MPMIFAHYTRSRNKRQAENEVPCELHKHLRYKQSCTLPTFVDVLSADGPCQPYSKARSSGPKDPRDHHGHEILFGTSGSIVSLASWVFADYFVSENVEQFANPYPDEDLGALDFLNQKISQIYGSNVAAPWYTGAMSIKLHNDDFIEAKKVRLPQLS